MLNIPMKTSRPITRDDLQSINGQKVQGALNINNVESLNRSPASQHSYPPAQSAYASAQPAYTPVQPTYTPAQPTPASVQPTYTPVRPASVQPTPAPVQPAPIVDKPVPPLPNLMQKGQKYALESNGKLSAVKACLGWNIKNAACELDVSAFMLNATGKVPGDDWFVFYGQTSSPDGSCLFSSGGGPDRETISVNMSRLNHDISKIVFVLTINDALEKKLNFSMVKDAYIRIVNCTTNETIVSFKLEEYYPNVTSMMIGELYLHNGAWKFNAVGSGVAKNLAGLCEMYGIQVI